MISVRQACVPRPEVLAGDLEDALFAADLAHVIEGRAPKVYQDPETFLRNTYPTAQLRKVVTAVFECLANPAGAGALVRLSTGFGGGKTHTLIALWHLARNVSRLSLGTELLPAAGRPSAVTVVGIDARPFGAEVCGVHGNLRTHSLWGELAYQLGGEEGYRRFRGTDAPDSDPHAADLRALFPEGPLLVLLDELVIYMAKLSERAQSALMGFLNNLIAEIVARPQSVLVITDPASQPAYAVTTEELKRQIAAALRLDDILARRSTEFDPIADEAAQVLSRRLFERVDAEAAQIASAEYLAAYQRIRATQPDALPGEAATADYAARIVRCYPFHPRLLDTAQNRLAAMPAFQQTRGVLRLFTRIVRDIWEKQRDPFLITAGDLDWASPRIRADLLARLDRDRFEAAVDADVLGHAGVLDKQFETEVHRRVASALLLESLPLTNTGIDKADLALAVLRPSDAGHEPAEAMDRLMSVCWHTYRDETRTRFLFRYEPNVIKIVEERSGQVPVEDARSNIHALVHQYYQGQTFLTVAFPSSPRAVADSSRLKLVLAETEALAQAICEYEDDTDPAAPVTRRFRNAIMALAPQRELLGAAISSQRRLIAAEEIAKEERAKGGHHKTPVLDQLEEYLPEWRRTARYDALRAWNRFVRQGQQPVTLDERYLVSRETPLGEMKNGQANLKKFLDANNYIYQPGDALDPDLLVNLLLPGATPVPDHQGAYTASSVHERALESKRLKLMLNEDPVRGAVLKAVAAGRLVVRLANGDVYDREGCVTGPQGQRKRQAGSMLSTLTLTDDVLLAPATAPCVQEWLKTDPTGGNGDTEPELLPIAKAAAIKGTTVQAVEEALDLGRLAQRWQDNERYVLRDARFEAWQPPDIRNKTVTATSWEQAFEYAERRPLLSLTLYAREASLARRLIAAAQPLGASSALLNITAEADLTMGGRLTLTVHDGKPTDPLKPQETFARLLQGAVKDSIVYEGELRLTFDEGRKGAGPALEQARRQAGDEISLEASFGPEVTDGSQ